MRHFSAPLCWIRNRLDYSRLYLSHDVVSSRLSGRPSLNVRWPWPTTSTKMNQRKKKVECRTGSLQRTIASRRTSSRRDHATSVARKNSPCQAGIQRPYLARSKTPSQATMSTANRGLVVDKGCCRSQRIRFQTSTAILNAIKAPDKPAYI